jgi:hypothetical protein
MQMSVTAAQAQGRPTRVGRVLLFAMLALAGPPVAPASAAEDYGKVYFGVPLHSTPRQAERLLAGIQGASTQVTNGARGPVVVARFQGGDMTVRYAGEEISFIHYQRGLLPIAGLRQVDDYFAERLGRPAFIELEDPQAYFSEAALQECTRQCTERCAGEASVFSCEAGRQCHSACRSGQLPDALKSLQDVLFDGTARSGGRHASYWSCGSDGGGGGGERDDIFAAAPTDCILRVTIDSCRSAQAGGEAHCRYSTLYRNHALERRFDGAQVAATEPDPRPAPSRPAGADPGVPEEPPRAGRVGESIADVRARARAQREAAESGAATEEPAAELDPDPQELSRRSERLATSQRASDPRVWRLDRELELDPDNLAALLERAELYYETGRPEIALRDLDHYLELSPGHERAEQLRGLVAGSGRTSGWDDGWRQPEPGVAIAHRIFGLPITADLEAVERFMAERGARETERDGDETGTSLAFEAGGAKWELFVTGATLTSVDYMSAPIDLSRIDEGYRKLLDDFGYPNHVDSVYGEDRSGFSTVSPEQRAAVDRHAECRKSCIDARPNRSRIYSGTYLCMDACFYQVPDEVDGLIAWLSDDHARLPLHLQLFRYHGAHPPLVWSCDTPPSGNPFRERAYKDCYVEGSLVHDSDGETFTVRIEYRNFEVR